MKNGIIIISLITLLIYSSPTFSQDSLWTSYVHEPESVNVIAEEGGYLWLVKNNDIMRMDKATSETESYYFLGSIAARDIIDLKIDRDGVKWICVGKILSAQEQIYYIASYDGTNLIIYDSTNSNLSVESAFPIKIAIDSTGNKWFGTTTGLRKYDGNTWTKYDTSTSASLKVIYSLAVDVDNNLWVGCLDALVKYNQVDWVEYEAPVTSQAIDFDSGKNPIIGSTGTLSTDKIYKFDGTNWIAIPLPFSPSPVHRFICEKVVVDDNDNLWVKERSQSLLFDGTEWTIFNADSFFIQDIFCDGSGDIWVGTSSLGNDGILAKYNMGVWDLFDVRSIFLPSNGIYDIAVDQNNFKWITTDEGLAKTDGKNWEVYNTSNSGLPTNNLGPVAVDASGIIWIGTQDGLLIKYEDPDWTVIDTLISLINIDSIKFIAVDNENNKWIGMQNEGLIKYDGLDWILYNTSNSGIPSNEINAITFDNQNNLWTAVADGIAKFDGTNWAIFNKPDSISSDQLTSVVIDDSNNVWCSDYYVGMLKFNGTNWTVFELNASFTSALAFTDAAVDDKGIVWVVCSGAGLIKFNGSEWTSVSTPSYDNENEFLRKVIIDKDEKKWCIGTGIFVYSGVDSVVTDVERPIESGKPDRYKLFQNYPNPFNPTTNIGFRIAESGLVTLKVYDLLGREVATLVNEEKPAGEYKVKFDAGNLSSGIYLYKISSGDFSQAKKMILLR